MSKPVNGCLRYFSLWVRLHSICFAVAFLVTGLTLDASAAENEITSRDRLVSLRTPVERIVSGGENTLVALVRESSNLVFIDLDQIVPIEQMIELDGVILELYPVQPGSGNVGVGVIGNGKARYYVRNQYRNVNLVRSYDIPSDFKRPAITLTPKFGVLWDRSPESQERPFHRIVLEQAKIVGKAPAFEIVSVGSPDVLLGLVAEAQQAVLIDADLGVAVDRILVPGVSVADPTDLQTFVPDAFSGGSGEAVIVNRESGVLTVLGSQGGDPPRLSAPLQIGLGDPGARAVDGGRLLVAADRALSMILVGAVGGSTMDVYGKVRGGIEKLEPIKAGFPIGDVAVMQRGDSKDSERLVFLSADGGNLRIVAFDALQGTRPAENIAASHLRVPSGRAFRPMANIAVSDSEATEEPSPLGREDVASIQRVLAALGFRIGAIDGLLGPSTRSAIRAFQLQCNLEATGEIGPATMRKFNETVSTIQSFGTLAPNQICPDVTDPSSRRNSASDMYALHGLVEDYQEFLHSNVPEANPIALLTLGSAHTDVSTPCFGLNSLPPRFLWSNSIGLARILSALETKHDIDVIVSSAYRTPSFNRCINDEPTSKHLDFAAMALAPFGNDAKDIERLSAALKAIATSDDLASGVAFKVRDLPGGVSVELLRLERGLVMRPTVYLQFAGGARETAKEFSRRLGDKGFFVPGEERLESALKKREIRYFHESDRVAAEELLNSAIITLNGMGIDNVPKVKVVDFVEFRGKKPELGVLELWIEF